MKGIKQSVTQWSCLQQQFLESPSPNCKSLPLCQQEISTQGNKCQDTSPGLPAEFTLPPLALSALAGPRPSLWHPAGHSWAIIQKCCLAPKGTLEMNSCTAPETLGDSTFLEGPEALAAHPQAL